MDNTNEPTAGESFAGTLPADGQSDSHEDGEGQVAPVAISALEHWSYCPRQCGLIHLEQTYDENYYTVRGQLAHERADGGQASTERGIRILRDVPVWSDRLGLIGKADVVELRAGVPYPVEYKSGQQRTWVHEAIQVCATAMCLEEMLGRAVPLGAVSYLASRARREVAFTLELREMVAAAAAGVRAMLREQRLPPAIHDARCRKCSLIESCLPSVLVDRARVNAAGAALFKPFGPGA